LQNIEKENKLIASDSYENNENNDANHAVNSIAEFSQHEDELDDDYLIRTCRYCKENSSAELEQLLHCDGIWLHALQYSGPGWEFHTPFPKWAILAQK
jgi:hypothetical protein